METDNIQGHNPKKAYTKAGLAVCAFVLLFNLIVIAAQIVYAAVWGADNLTIKHVLLMNIIAEVLIAMPVFYFIVRKVPTVVPEKKKMGFGSFMACVCMMYAVSIFGSLIGQFINGILVSATGRVSEANIDVLFDTDFFMTALYCVIAAPIVEEFVFRKLLIDKLQVYSEKYAVLLSGLTFGLMHGNFEQFFYAFFMGCLLAYIYVRTGRIIYTVLLHFILNGVSTALQFLITKVTVLNELENLTDTQLVEILFQDETQLIAFLFMAAIVFAEYIMAFIGLILLIVKRKNFFFSDNGQEITAKTVFLNYGMILAFAAMLGLMVLNLFW